MAVSVLRGPAGGGKSQTLLRGEVRVDLTALWVALRGLERDGEGRYPERRTGDPALRIASYLKAAAVRFAAEQGIDAVVTTSSSAPEAVERLRELGALGPVRTVDPGEEVVRRRLAGPDGQLSAECETAIGRWYRR